MRALHAVMWPPTATRTVLVVPLPQLAHVECVACIAGAHLWGVTGVPSLGAGGCYCRSTSTFMLANFCIVLVHAQDMGQREQVL